MQTTHSQGGEAVELTTKEWHLFAHDDAGFYAAESLEEARELFIADCGDEDAARAIEAVPDDTSLTVADADGPHERVLVDGLPRIRYLDRETKTAKEWATSATHKGYQFGGDV
jgi:hypothetical protein